MGLDYSRSSPFGHVLGNTCRMAKNLIQAEISKKFACNFANDDTTKKKFFKKACNFRIPLL